MGPVVGIVGLGTMGLGIAQVFAGAGFQVLAYDAFAMGSAIKRMADSLAQRVATGKLHPGQRDQILAAVTEVRDPGDLAPAEMVIEAIIEDLAAKKALIATLEKVVSSDAVLASNTSSIPVAALAMGARHPGRILAAHFFNPAPAMRLVELAGHTGTAPAALVRARALIEATGKVVIASPDRPGFIVNRCARPFYGEALAILEEGRSASDIDAAMLAAGYRLGPLSLIDLIGSDINQAATIGLWAAMGQHPRYHPFEALTAAVAAGRLGRKSGAGFVYPATVGPPPDDAGNIALRIEATLVNEAHWLLAEGGVTPDGIDQAMRLGLNFPRGPFEAMALHGRAEICATLAALEARAPTHLKGRYRAAPGLEDS